MENYIIQTRTYTAIDYTRNKPVPVTFTELVFEGKPKDRVSQFYKNESSIKETDEPSEETLEVLLK